MSSWEVRFSTSRQLPYFYNPTTQQSVWEPPAELSPQQLAALPGAAKYLSAGQDPGQAGGGGKEGQVRASHILCKHVGSRRASSWREVSAVVNAVLLGHIADLARHSPPLPGNHRSRLGPTIRLPRFASFNLGSKATITRPLPAARATIQKHIARLRSVPPGDVPQEFARIASTESDCSSAKKGGDLGWFGRGMMQKSFEDATYALQPGQLSDIVESDSGVHVILRTG